MEKITKHISTKAIILFLAVEKVLIKFLKSNAVINKQHRET